MVQRETSGPALFWWQDIGEGQDKVTVTPGEAAGYNTALATEDAQLNTRIQNKTALDNWRTAQANYQVSVDAGRGDTVTPPPKPSLTLISDPVKWPDGSVTPGQKYTYQPEA